ncbi:type IV pilin protein [Parasynechococcus sp.]|uniref:type IV pilin protein n=1 Tax=Parasynechococcus sp. TaxID=3101203 RepID=UPI003704C29F
MVVIIIIGVLSAVALPNFLSQTNKAKATECTTKMGSIMSMVSAEHLLSTTDTDALLTSEAAIANTNSNLCTFAEDAAANAIANTYGVTSAGK